LSGLKRKPAAPQVDVDTGAGILNKQQTPRGIVVRHHTRDPDRKTPMSLFVLEFPNLVDLGEQGKVGGRLRSERMFVPMRTVSSWRSPRSTIASAIASISTRWQSSAPEASCG
jgi:hypothetical protein